MNGPSQNVQDATEGIAERRSSETTDSNDVSDKHPSEGDVRNGTLSRHKTSASHPAEKTLPVKSLHKKDLTANISGKTSIKNYATEKRHTGKPKRTTSTVFQNARKRRVLAKDMLMG